MSDHKHCPRCQEDWPADTDFFYADERSPDGLFYCCKACFGLLRAASRSRRGQGVAAPTPRATDALAQVRWLGGAP